MARNTKKIDGKVLAEYRKSAKLSQLDLAVILGRSREWVSAIENNEEPSIVVISLDLIQQWMNVCHRRIAAYGQLERAETLKSSILSSILNIFIK
ncbi:helix-turn-helix transcriptional regulator [Paraglaciecola sp.]|uniref:helix-turn-helix domain-containing protein n=1 Tax=Paraglaciecola sp. TaxID=1920173 RepID=UPI0030F43279